MEMSVSQHNGEVASGMQAIAQGITSLMDKTTRTQETHDMVIKLEGKMDSVEAFMARITKQLDELPAKLDACYARKEEVAADRRETAELKSVVDGFRNRLIAFSFAVFASAVLIALGISDKVHL
jgi:septal ring factor EnvC (AmiA/AmiB activator)